MTNADGMGGNTARGTAVLEVSEAVAGYGDVTVLESVSFAAHRGELVALVGPNGAGKSTALKAVLGLAKLSSGSVRYEGRNISRTRTDILVKLGISYVPQGRIVFPQMTVLENLQMGAFTRNSGDVAGGIRTVFDLFPDLQKFRRRRAGELSGGQQQMVAIGRALMAAPSTILLDEPSLGLSPRFSDVVFDALCELRAQGLSLLMVEQNASKALRIADYAYVLEFGKNRYEGTGGDLLKDDAVRHLYLGHTD
jgi:branched-chain amino acid transport system ATP-binding protein